MHVERARSDLLPELGHCLFLSQLAKHDGRHVINYSRYLDSLVLKLKSKLLYTTCYFTHIVVDISVDDGSKTPSLVLVVSIIVYYS